MILSDRMWRAIPGTLLPLRVFMGVQMLLYGMAYLWVGTAHRFYSRMVAMDLGELWLVGLTVGGGWLLLSAVCEGWVRMKAATIPRRVTLNGLIVGIGRTRFCCYYFCGSVWGGLGVGSWGDPTRTLMDWMAPTFIIFLTWMAVNDAYQRRKYWIAHPQPTFALGK
jgi:hypothetical protein